MLLGASKHCMQGLAAMSGIASNKLELAACIMVGLECGIVFVELLRTQIHGPHKLHYFRFRFVDNKAEVFQGYLLRKNCQSCLGNLGLKTFIFLNC